MKKEEFEKVIIKSLYANETVCSKVLPELSHDWFSNPDCKSIAKHIIDFNTKYSRMPNVLETKSVLSDDDDLNTFNTCMNIQDDDVNTDYILRRNTNIC